MELYYAYDFRQTTGLDKCRIIIFGLNFDKIQQYFKIQIASKIFELKKMKKFKKGN